MCRHTVAPVHLPVGLGAEGRWQIACSRSRSQVYEKSLILRIKEPYILLKETC